MKKILSLVTLCITLLSANVHSQKARIGVTAGTTIGTYKIKAESVSITSKAKAGITLGLISDIPLGRSGSFMPALNFVQKGGVLKPEGVKDQLTFNYLEVPLNLVYNAKITSGKLFLGAGPSLSMGISGKDKWNAEGSSGSEKIKFGKDQDFKRFDAGMNFVSGYVAKSGLIISLNYNYGLSNAIGGNDDGGKFKNRYAGLRIGYFL